MLSKRSFKSCVIMSLKSQAPLFGALLSAVKQLQFRPKMHAFLKKVLRPRYVPLITCIVTAGPMTVFVSHRALCSPSLLMETRPEDL